MNLLDFKNLKNPTSLFPLNENNVPPTVPIPDNFFSRLLPKAAQAKEDRLAKLRKDLVTQDYINRFGEYGNNSQRRIADLNIPESTPYGNVTPYLKGTIPPSERKFENPNIIPKASGNNIVGQEDWYESYNRSPDNPNAFPVGQEPISNEIVDPNQKEPEEKTSRFESLFNIFDDKDRLAKIATGIALMEGTPMQEAFELGANIRAQGAVEGGSLFDFINKKTGVKQFTRSNKDPQFDGLVRSNLFDVVPVGTGSDALLERNNKFLDADLSIINKTREGVEANNLIDANLTEMLKLLESGTLKTGKAAEYLLPFERLVKAKGLSQKEEFLALQNQIIPLMRPPGSGSTSDYEVELYKASTANMSNSVEGNIKIIKSALAYNRLQRERILYIDNAVYEGARFGNASNQFYKDLENNTELQAKIFNVEDGVPIVKKASIDNIDTAGTYFNSDTQSYFTITDQMLSNKER